MIYAELSGGLGNQMFVYAFARAMGLCCQEPVTLIDRQDWKPAPRPTLHWHCRHCISAQRCSSSQMQALPSSICRCRTPPRP